MKKILSMFQLDMMCMIFALMSFGVLLITQSTFAVGLEIPEVDLFEKIAALLSNWKSIGSIGRGVSIILIVTQILKQMGDFQYKRILTSLLAILYGIGIMVIEGKSIGAASIAVIISGGGAMLLYDSLKPFLKSIPFFDFLNLGKK